MAYTALFGQLDDALDRLIWNGLFTDPFPRPLTIPLLNGYAHCEIVTKEAKACPICLENMEKGKKAHMLACAHTFHAKCIAEAVKHKKACPVCKTVIKM